MLGLNSLHLFQTFQHAPQVSDAILKGNFLIVAWMSGLKQFPYVYLFGLFLSLLLPVNDGQGICMQLGLENREEVLWRKNTM